MVTLAPATKLSTGPCSSCSLSSSSRSSVVATKRSPSRYASTSRKSPGTRSPMRKILERSVSSSKRVAESMLTVTDPGTSCSVTVPASASTAPSGPSTLIRPRRDWTVFASSRPASQIPLICTTAPLARIRPAGCSIALEASTSTPPTWKLVESRYPVTAP